MTKLNSEILSSNNFYSDLKPCWSKDSTVNTDYTFHQIAPYIGRMKTTIARFLLDNFTNKGDLIVDPFCGCGVVGLEAASSGRSIIAGDWNPYAVLLTRAKLFPPVSLEAAESRLENAWDNAQTRFIKQDLRTVPKWVRKFFHPETLRNTLAFRDSCIDLGDDFLLACLLGILHHQRTGFLSYPASHLVPYLRDKKFPKDQFPKMYQEREVLPRLQAKLKRTFKRPPNKFMESRKVYEIDARKFPKVKNVKAIITSPPYMNALDYVRDNRLRIWFINRSLPNEIEISRHNKDQAYSSLIKNVCALFSQNIVTGGYIILVVGDASKRSSRNGQTTKLTLELFNNASSLNSFKLAKFYEDTIPDIRRSRKECSGTKKESILIFKKM